MVRHDETEKGPPATTPSAERRARLAAELKRNLARRKAQARGRKSGAAEPSSSDGGNGEGPP
jgi:hypothetical protein